jgi:RNA polymerase sigma-70 factor (ECF subfamily)
MTDCPSVSHPWPISESSEDASLVSAARDGDRQAFGWLYLRYSRMVHGILLARVPATEVDDMVQDIFLHVLPRLNALRDLTRFGGWLATITRNRANDYYRKSQAVTSMTEVLWEDQVEAPPATNAEELSAEMILGLVLTLPDTYREPLILRLVEGMTGPEIAARTGLTPGSVRVNLHRGMQQLREKLSVKSGEKQRTAVTKLDQPFARQGLLARWKSRLRQRNAP